MDQVKVYYDRIGNTLTAWFGNPEDEVVLMKDKTGRVIGFEKLNFAHASPDPMHVAFETVGF